MQLPSPGDSIPGGVMSPAAMMTISSLHMKHPKNDEVFVDTSAFYAVLDADDEAHLQASTEVAWID